MNTNRDESRKLATFLEVGQALTGAHRLKTALARVLETLGRHHGMIRSAIMLLDGDTGDTHALTSVSLLTWKTR